MQDNNYIVNSNNHIMDRNLYQQCSGAHVFRRMSCLITVFCVLLFLCVRVPVCVTISRLPCTYIYKRIVTRGCIYVCVCVCVYVCVLSSFKRQM